MKFFHQAALLLFLGYSMGAEFSVIDDIENLDFIERIVGGKVARHGVFPWMVSVHEKYPRQALDHVCGGAILNENWIITAAHCIDWPNDVWRYEAIVGMHNLATKHSPSVRRHKISKIVLHEDYDYDSSQNDIALLKTKKPIDIEGSDGYVRPINLPKPGAEPTGTATVIGWGHTVTDGEMFDELLTVTIPIVDRDSCIESYDKDPFDDVHPITEDMICAGETRKDSCQADSGGPLFQWRRVSTLIGIVSWGAGCGVRHYPGVYTRVSSYVYWIRQTMKE